MSFYPYFLNNQIHPRGFEQSSLSNQMININLFPNVGLIFG